MSSKTRKSGSVDFPKESLAGTAKPNEAQASAPVVVKKKPVPTPTVSALVSELTKNPASGIELVRTLGRITKPWEAIGSDGALVNEIPVPEGVSPRDFKRKQMGAYVSGFRLVTIFGNDVATILKGTPKWKIEIEGRIQADAPFVLHAKMAEEHAKKFVEERLEAMGYIIGT